MPLLPFSLSGTMAMYLTLGGVAVAVFILLWPFWKIFTKAGFSGWLCMLLLVPVVNIILLYVIAFSDWPALKRTTKKDHSINSRHGCPPD
ncbi:hypothetical protein ACQZV8_12750 [Magnetococcales bacterium HHB-1]